jgi:tetratricopeptide (TPR) repeat protein
MQRLYTIVFIAAAVLMIYFGTQALTNPQDEKITAFNASLNDEAKKDYNSAIKRLMSVYEANKQNYLINLRLGWLNYLKGSFQESRKYYNTAISLTGQKSIEPYLGLTYPLAALESWDELENTYNKILKLDPKNFNANLRLGQIFLNRGDNQNAKDYLEKAISLYQADYEVNHSLGWAYYYLGNKKRAMELFTSALMLNPKDSLATQGYYLSR